MQHIFQSNIYANINALHSWKSVLVWREKCHMNHRYLFYLMHSYYIALHMVNNFVLKCHSTHLQICLPTKLSPSGSKLRPSKYHNKMIPFWLKSASLSTHWGRVTHICVGNLTIIGSDNGLSPGRRQAIIWSNAGILLIGLVGTNPSQIVIGMQAFSFKKCTWKCLLRNGAPFDSASMC